MGLRTLLPPRHVVPAHRAPRKQSLRGWNLGGGGITNNELRVTSN